MQSVPLIPESAPFTAEQRAWLNGFLAGFLNRAQRTAPIAPAAARQHLTILFGTQTGNAEVLAKRAAKLAKERGFDATVVDMASTDLPQLAKASALLLIVSTYGEGDPPDSARALHAACAAGTPGTLEGIPYALCALGDRAYVHFCRCGQEFDERLEKLGARRVFPRLEVDGDPALTFPTWLDQALAAFPGAEGHAAPSRAPETATEAGEHQAEAWSRSRPYKAPIVEVRRLSAPASAKEVNHVALDLSASGMCYEPGDALGVLPRNAPRLVAEVLALLGCDGEEAVPDGSGGTCALQHALEHHYDLGRPTDALLGLTEVADRASVPQVIDVLEKAGTRPEAAAFARTLRRLQPRLYSISSSLRRHPGEVHLTVGAVRYTLHGRERLGVCSTFLADHASTLGYAEVFVHQNRSFRLPVDASTPIIMIGPGTGIAPFRAFLEEREVSQAQGRNWLLFGDQHEAHDFLYRDQMEDWQKTGLLTRLDLAWSRDQSEKVYVQDRLRAAGAEIWRWLEEGAHLYVCGDASRMAKDVESALHKIISVHGELSAEKADAYVTRLRETRRYQRDVY